MESSPMGNGILGVVCSPKAPSRTHLLAPETLVSCHTGAQKGESYHSDDHGSSASKANPIPASSGIHQKPTTLPFLASASLKPTHLNQFAFSLKKNHHASERKNPPHRHLPKRPSPRTLLLPFQLDGTEVKSTPEDFFFATMCCSEPFLPLPRAFASVIGGRVFDAPRGM